MDVIRIAASIVIAYAIGNISSALILGRLVFKKDIRDSGSGSAGATNMFRTFGAKWGVLTLLLDIAKGSAAYGIGWLIGGAELNLWCASLAGAFIIIGHDWPVFYKFKGGKGAAASVGVMLAINPFVAVGCLALAILAAALTRYMSVGSLVAIVIGSGYAIIWEPLPTKLLFVLILLLDFWQHRANIIRLFKGEENPMVSRSLIDHLRGKKKGGRDLK